MLDLTSYPLIARFAEINRFDQTALNRSISSILSQYSHADNFRDMLIDPDIAYDDATDSFHLMILTPTAFAQCAEMLRYALDDTNQHFTEQITELALMHSLCPLHRIDYAICFDDDDAECAQIRAIHPSHDT